MKVQTTDGEFDHAVLEVRDVSTIGDNCRVLATEWRLHGKLVRRDVWVNVLSAPEIGIAKGNPS